MKNKTLIFGASLKEHRASNRAVRMLQEYDHSVVAFGLREGDIGNVSINTEKLPYQDIHTITLYMNPMRLKDHWEYLRSLSPKRMIFNPGTEDHELIRLAKEDGIEVEIGCTLVMLRTAQYTIT